MSVGSRGSCRSALANSGERHQHLTTKTVDWRVRGSNALKAPASQGWSIQVVGPVVCTLGFFISSRDKCPSASCQVHHLILSASCSGQIAVGVPAALHLPWAGGGPQGPHAKELLAPER